MGVKEGATRTCSLSDCSNNVTKLSIWCETPECDYVLCSECSWEFAHCSSYGAIQCDECMREKPSTRCLDCTASDVGTDSGMIQNVYYEHDIKYFTLWVGSNLSEEVEQSDNESEPPADRKRTRYRGPYAVNNKG